MDPKGRIYKGNRRWSILPFRHVRCLVVPDKPAELLRILGGAKEVSRWSIWEVRPAEEFAGIFVVGGGSWEVQYWQWSG